MLFVTSIMSLKAALIAIWTCSLLGCAGSLENDEDEETSLPPGAFPDDVSTTTADLATCPGAPKDGFFVTDDVVTHDFLGFGAQFNHNVYADISKQVGVTEENVVQMEQKVKALRPEFVRVFFHYWSFTRPDMMGSFRRVLQLAQDSGSTVNVTWQGGGMRDESELQRSLTQFASLLRDLITTGNLTAVKWATFQNEINTDAGMSFQQYEHIYRSFDQALKTAGIRDRVKIACGDLLFEKTRIQEAQGGYLDYTARHMSDICDAYSVHIYWRYFDTTHLVGPLMTVQALQASWPQAIRRPLQITEYGAGGHDVAGLQGSGVDGHGRRFQRTILNAFQTAFFDLLAVRRGFTALSKWDAYFGKYDRGTQAWYMIEGPQTGWALNPAYHLTSMLTHTVPAGSDVLHVRGTIPKEHVVAFRGPSGEFTLVGLNRAYDTRKFTLAGLPASTTLHHWAWNFGGAGLVTMRPDVATGSRCLAEFEVPARSVFALSTIAP
jgi:hypothetical protein